MKKGRKDVKPWKVGRRTMKCWSLSKDQTVPCIHSLIGALIAYSRPTQDCAHQQFTLGWGREAIGHFLYTLNFGVLLGSSVSRSLSAAEDPELSSRIR